MPGNKFNPDDKNPHQLPSGYIFLKVLGQGSFGKVMKCWRKETKDIVAVKIPKSWIDGRQESSMLKKFMDLNLDRHNIVKLMDWFDTSCGRALVFEMLDISIEDYILKNRCGPLCLNDIRSIIQQMAIAFSALKNIGVIHTDIKPDNIMLVDHQRRPLRAKLIDFGLAISQSKAKQGMIVQTVVFRAPEIILGLPFTEAIDMWSLGGVMAAMILGFVLFPVQAEYEALQLIVELLGQLGDHHLNHGRKTHMYFIRTETNSWRLKTPQEYWGKHPPKKCRSANFHSLDDLKTIRLEKMNKTEAEEREQCVELLKAMLQLDETERITPKEVVNHPFITKNYPSSNNQAIKSAAAQQQLLKKKKIKKEIKVTTKKRAGSTNKSFNPASTKPPPSPILVRPAAAMGIHSDVKSNFSLQTTSSGEDLEPPAITYAPPDHRSASPTDPPRGMIMVQPAAAENTLQLEEQECAVSFQDELHMKSESLLKIIESETVAGTPEDPPKFDDTSVRRKKRKNCFQHIFSWMGSGVCISSL